MLITSGNMPIQVDPIGINNIQIIRYVIRPNPASVQSARRCLFGRSDPEQNKRIYENAANSERNRCILRYSFDPVKSEFVDQHESNSDVINQIDKNETVKIDGDGDRKQQQQCLVVGTQNDDGSDVVRVVCNGEKSCNTSTSESSEVLCNENDVIQLKFSLKSHVQGSRMHNVRPYERKRYISDYFPKKKKSTS